MNEGLRIARAIEMADRARHQAALETKRRRREIGEDTDLTSEAKVIALRKLNDEGLATHTKLTTEIQRLQARADEYAKLRATRPVDAAARVRTEKLIAKGFAFNQIIDRAVENADPEIVAALRLEALYHGDKHGFVDVPATIEACDRALAQIAHGEEREVNRGLVRLREVAEPVDATGEYSAKVALGQDTPLDLLTVAFATGSGRQEDDDA
jgi:hypothetical protein